MLLFVKQASRHWAFASALVVLGCLMLVPFGDLDQPGNVVPFLAGGLTISLGFLVALRALQVPAALFWAIAIGTRLILLPMTPGADIYRYIWEGEVQNHGFSPYCAAPSSPTLASLRDGVWDHVRFQDASAIYPPLAELCFRAVAFVSATAISFKLLFVAADLLTCLLLARRFGSTRAVTFAWNPIVIYSSAGGGHYDSLFVLAMTASWLLWQRKDGSAASRLASAASMGASVALRWLSAPLLVWQLWKIARRDGLGAALRAAAVASLPLAASWAIVANGNWTCPLFPSGFVAAARSAEALPAVASWLLPPTHILNRNDVYLGAFLVLSAILLWRQPSIRRAAQAILSAALLTTPMFHAWYATWLVPFAVKDRDPSAIALSISAFVYFWLHHTAGQPNGVWKQSGVEKLLLWGPFVICLAWKAVAANRAIRSGGPLPASDFE